MRICSCRTCNIGRVLDPAIRRMTIRERKMLDELYTRMFCAETDIEWMNAKAQDREDIKINGVWYTPKEKN